MLKRLVVPVAVMALAGSAPVPASAQATPKCAVPVPVVGTVAPILHIPAGGSQTLPVTMTLRARPLLVDVDFLLDTSGSMLGVACGVIHQVEAITRDLRWRGYDAWVGLADYQDYPTQWLPPACADGIHPYRRIRDMAPPSSAFSNAVRSLSYCENLDEPESALAALYQSATGEGQFPFISPGQQASFRAGAVRMAMNITNSAFNDDTRTPLYPGPDMEVAASALIERGVRQIGIVVNDDVDHLAAKADVDRMASVTGAVARENGAECSAGPATDHPAIAAGDPLVCVATEEMLHSTAISGPIIELLEGPAEPQTVSLVEPTPSGLVSSIAPRSYEGVNARAAHLLPFRVSLTCDREDAGRRFEVRLELRVHGHDNDSDRSDPRSFSIHCGARR